MISSAAAAAGAAEHSIAAISLAAAPASNHMDMGAEVPALEAAPLVNFQGAVAFIQGESSPSQLHSFARSCWQREATACTPLVILQALALAQQFTRIRPVPIEPKHLPAYDRALQQHGQPHSMLRASVFVASLSTFLFAAAHDLILHCPCYLLLLL